MSTVVSCTCGARIKLPETRGNVVLRCPKCKAELVTPAEGQIVTSALADPRALGATCPICQTSIGADEASLVCPACDQVHHRECWNDVGGCATYGCENAPKSEKTAVADGALGGLGRYQAVPGLRRDDQGDRAALPVLRHRFRDGRSADAQRPAQPGWQRGAAPDDQSDCDRAVRAQHRRLSGAACRRLPRWRTSCSSTGRSPRRGPRYLVMGYSAMGISVLYSILMVLFLLSAAVSG